MKIKNSAREERKFSSAVGGGFEPPVPVKEQRFSRPPRSTAPASHRLCKRACKFRKKIRLLFFVPDFFPPLFHFLSFAQGNNHKNAVMFDDGIIFQS